MEPLSSQAPRKRWCPGSSQGLAGVAATQHSPRLLGHGVALLPGLDRRLLSPWSPQELSSTDVTSSLWLCPTRTTGEPQSASVWSTSPGK